MWNNMTVEAFLKIEAYYNHEAYWKFLFLMVS